MQRGLILINAYSKLEHSLNQSRRLKEEFEKLNIRTDIRNNNFFASTIDDCGNICSDLNYDFCVYLDKDKYISQMLEKIGMRLFNSHFSVCACDDKMTTSILLADNGIKMPMTIPGLLCYDPEQPVDQNALDIVEQKLQYPLIAKSSYGSLGSGIFKIENRNRLNEIAEKLKCTPHLFQKFVASSEGRDVRVIVIGGKTVAAMKRVSDCDFRSNIELGGRGEIFEADEKLRALCEKAAAVLKLDYCGIDVLFGEDGYLLCEVNSNAFFGGIERVTGVNVAKLYAEHILNSLK